MTRNHGILVMVAVFFAALLPTATVLAFPSLPSSFYGIVKYNDTNIPEGTLVEALIDNQVFATGYSEMYQGNSVYTLDVRGDDSDTAEKDGGLEGDTINFRVGGLKAKETAIWHAGTNVSLDLSVDSTSALNSPHSTPTALSTQTPIAYQAAGGGSKGFIIKPAMIIIAVILVSLLAGLFWIIKKKSPGKRDR